jgi:outer membrane cobalamin receptor
MSPLPLYPQQTTDSPPLLKTSINVNETISTDTPALVTLFDQLQIEASPGVNLDDRLRMVPGFTLFRRTSGVVANPTTQGISLRGIGSSGASRTLLLWDGIPENDPFGGWVFWDRFAPDELERVEISRGASTSVFGDLAMGGAIAMFSRPTTNLLDLSYEAGTHNTGELSAGFSHAWQRFAASIETRAFRTDGYFIVPAYLRGPVDRQAGVDFVAGDARLDYFTSTDRLFVRLDMLAEERQNGTALQTNSTGLGSISANYSHQWTHDEVSLLAYHTREGFHAVFSSVNATRTKETLSFTQSVPSEAVGSAFVYRHDGGFWHVLAGADFQRTEGVDTDYLRPTGLRIGGGIIWERGAFVQADAHLGPVQFFVGSRYELALHNSFYSPSGGFTIGKQRWRARGSVYRAFRAPTLNELYRTFRQGNAITEANAGLVPETMFGAEAGFDFVGEKTHAGVTFYRNSLDNLITNVTLQSGATIIRQRQNAAAALARGIEATVHRDWGNFHGDLSYMFADSRFITGLRISQVPRNQGTAQLSYSHKSTLLSAGVRAYSLQFDDDLNQFVLPGFMTVGLTARQTLTHNLTANVAVDNLLDRQYIVALTPTPNTGSPLLVRVGLKLQFR